MGFLSDVSNLVDTVKNLINPPQAPTPGKIGYDEIKGKTVQPLANNWNTLHTYSFAMYHADDNGQVRPNDPATDITVNGINVIPGEAKIELPLAPSSISISTQFANVVTPTNAGGVLLEDSGALFKIITISGTTGLWPERPARGDGLTGAAGVATAIGNALFPAATSAALGLVGSVKKTFSSITGPSASTDKGPDALSDDQIYSTGYWKFWMLHNFFIAYAEAKRDADYKDLRLTFISWKDNTGYTCAPVQFDLRRSASNPLEYQYNITLKAWETFGPYGDHDNSLYQDGIDIRNPSLIRSALDVLRNTRNTLQQSQAVIAGVQSDIGDVINVVNQAYLVGKDSVGLAADVVDFGSTIKANGGIIYRYNQNVFNQEIDRYNAGPTGSGSFPPMTPSQTSDAKSEAAAAAVKAQHGVASRTSTNTIVDTIVSNPDLGEQLSLNTLKIHPAVQTQIAAQLDAARDNATPGQIRAAAQAINTVGDNLAAAGNMMDPTYAQIYGLPAPVNTGKTLTEDDLIMMADIDAGADSLLLLLAGNTVYPSLDPNPFTDANAAIPTEDQMNSPVSAVPIFVPRGRTLEDIADQFFGDPRKARDIAILNGLRAPYIDEDGFTAPISGATGRDFVTSATNLVMNQAITIGSSTASPTRRHILNITDLGGGQFKVTVDGNDDLDKYVAAASPYLNARLPGCVGSGDVILLPSLQAPDDTSVDRPTVLLQKLSYAERIFKIDIALDPHTNDLAIDPTGDFQRSFGYANAVQAMKSIVETEQGELEDHPQFGLPPIIGQPDSNISPDTLIRIIRSRIISDPRFTDANVQIKVEGTAVWVRIDAKGSSGTGRIPVEFKTDSNS